MLGGAKKRRPCCPCCPGGPSRDGRNATARWLPTRRPARAPLPRRACSSHDTARGTLTTLLRGAQRGFRTPRDGDLVLPRTSSAVKPARDRSSAPSRQSEKGVQSKRWSVRGTATVELFASVLNAAVCSAAGAGVDWQRRRQQIYQPLFDCDQVPTGPHGCSRASDLRQLNSKLRTPYPAPGC